MSQANPIQLFVTHGWDNSDDYLRVFEYLESANNFFYKNCSTPDHMPAGDKEALRESLRKQIAPAEVVIALPSLAQNNRELLQFQMVFAQACNKPVVLMKNFGSDTPVAKVIAELANEIVDWDEPRARGQLHQAPGAPRGNQPLGSHRVQTRLNRFMGRGGRPALS